MVNRETDGGDSKEEGPLAEVRFWASRSVRLARLHTRTPLAPHWAWAHRRAANRAIQVDLSGIHEQLERKGVRQVVEVLRAAKSSYLKPFLDLSRSIEEGHEEAHALRSIERAAYGTHVPDMCIHGVRLGRR